MQSHYMSILKHYVFLLIRSLFAPLRYTTYTSTGYVNKLKTRHTIPQ